MSKTVTKTGSPAWTILLIAFLLMIFFVAFVVVFSLVAPEKFHQILDASFGSTDSYYYGQYNQSQAELDATKGNLTAAQTQIGALQAALLGERAKRYAWPLLIGVIIVGLVALWLLWKWLSGKRGLTMEEARRKYEPRVRTKYAFDQTRYPYAPVVRMKSIERVKRKDVTDPDAFMYFFEFFFCDEHDKSRYIKGHVKPPRPLVVTVAVLNINDEYRQQWYPFMRMDEAMSEAHRIELWGFAMQKTKTEDDVLAALQNSKSVDEVKKEYQVEGDE